MQQQLAVAVATDRKKATMIEQLDKVYFYLSLELCLSINTAVPFSSSMGGTGLEFLKVLVLDLNLYEVCQRKGSCYLDSEFGLRTILEKIGAKHTPEHEN